MIAYSMELIARGAEANLYRDGGKIVKERVRKEYRIPELDERLRRSRTRRESKLLDKAKRAGVPVPRIHHTDIARRRIIMEFIEGRILKEVINTGDKENVKRISREIGGAIARLHESNLIHNDLTTSNMILRDDKICFIDFGLGMTSRRVEDKAMDMVVLKKALHATHTDRFDFIWNSIIEGYGEGSEKREILSRIRTIEKRVRYV